MEIVYPEADLSVRHVMKPLLPFELLFCGPRGIVYFVYFCCGGLNGLAVGMGSYD